MSFIQPCFIRKNTPELREKLEGMGYVSCCPFDSRCDAICTLLRDNKPEYMIFKIDNDFEINVKDSYPFIDAGTNEDLFLALAALRDDGDFAQWFTDGKRWYQNKINDREILRFGAGNPINFHKATVEELIKHFKLWN